MLFGDPRGWVPPPVEVRPTVMFDDDDPPSGSSDELDVYHAPELLEASSLAGGSDPSAGSAPAASCAALGLAGVSAHAVKRVPLTVTRGRGRRPEHPAYDHLPLGNLAGPDRPAGNSDGDPTRLAEPDDEA